MSWPFPTNYSDGTYGYNTTPDANFYSNFPGNSLPYSNIPNVPPPFLSGPPSLPLPPPLLTSSSPLPPPLSYPSSLVPPPLMTTNVIGSSSSFSPYPSIVPQYPSEYKPPILPPLTSSSYSSYQSSNYTPTSYNNNNFNTSPSTNNSNTFSSPTTSTSFGSSTTIPNPPSFSDTSYPSSTFSSTNRYDPYSIPGYSTIPPPPPPPPTTTTTTTTATTTTTTTTPPTTTSSSSYSIIPTPPLFSTSSTQSTNDSSFISSTPSSSSSFFSTSSMFTLPSTTIPTYIPLTYSVPNISSSPSSVSVSQSSSTSFSSSQYSSSESSHFSSVSSHSPPKSQPLPISARPHSPSSPSKHSTSSLRLQHSTSSLTISHTSTQQQNLSTSPLSEAKQKLLQEQQELEKKKNELADLRKYQEAQKHFIELQRKYLEQEKRKREMKRLREEKEKLEMERKQQEVERRARELERLRQEQKKLKREEEEKRKQQLQQQQKLEEQRRKQQQEEEAEKKRKEQEQKQNLNVKMSFFSTLIEAAQLIAQNCSRLSTIINEYYQNVMIVGSEARNLLLDVINHLELTLTRLINLLANNVWNIEDNLHNSIKTAAAALNSTVKALITCVKDVTDRQRTSTISTEERSKQLRQHNVAVSYAIKTLVEELLKLKVAERLDPNAAKLLSASSIEEAEEISTAVVGTLQALEEMSKLQIQQEVAPQSTVRVKPPRPKGPPPSVQAKPAARLSSYDVNKIITLQRVIRRFLVRARWKRLVREFRASPESKELRQRIKVMQEIINSEKSYVQSLETAIKFYYEPLKEQANSSRPVATLQQVNTIFSSIETIYLFTLELKKKLDERMKQWPSVQFIGDIFAELAPMMKLYADYVNKFDTAIKVFKELMQNKRFVEFLKECRRKSGHNLDLPSFLIMPVQRMPRYQLLLKELLKYTPREHVDWKNISDALEKITEVNVWINKKKQEQDNRMKILALEEMIKSPVPLALVAPHRLFLRQGPLLCKRSDVDKDNISIIMFMFNDMLVLTKQLSANSFEYVDKIMLQKTELKDLNNTSFQLIEDKKRQFTFTCSTPQEKMDWVKELKETLQTLSLHTLVTENLNDTSIKEGFVVLSATYGPLHKPKNCVDVTQAIRKIVQEQGGNSLTLRAETKSKLPGFTIPSSKHNPKKNSLVIVYSVNGTVHTKTFYDNEAVYLDASTV